MYEWDAVSESWFQIAEGYNPAFDFELPTSGDHIVHLPPSPTPSPSPVPPYDPQLPVMPQGCSPPPPQGGTTFPPVVVTASRPSSFGSILSIIWRGAMLGGAAQRGVGGGGSAPASAALPAHPGSEPVKCDSELVVKISNAQFNASRYGFRPVVSRGRKITIRWSTGTVETYVATGQIGTGWMMPVPGTCRDRE